MFVTEEVGYDLLCMIEEERRYLLTNINNITITFEYDTIS
jgi:hypothetical protein